MTTRTSKAIWERAARVATAWLALAAFSAATQAQDKPECTAGTTLRLSAAEARQGSLLLIEVKSGKPLAEVQGEWDGKSVPLWQEGTSGGRRKGLLGIDLAKAPGEYELKITGQTVSGEKVGCNVKVAVKIGLFATEKLQVEKQFVEPNPEQAKRAEEEGQKLGAILDHVTPERLWDGKFRIPLDGVTSGRNFGKRRILNGIPRSPHTGVDLPGSTGTPVHAAQKGRVALAEELFFAGNAVVVDHGLGIYTFYAHLSEIDVKAGDAVETGSVLGKVGATGRVTGPHLHWGLTVERARVNPLLLVKLTGETGAPAAQKKAVRH
jgi:murein DD-endopeptidase MepM/ murein hydrolase activator NlpD